MDKTQRRDAIQSLLRQHPCLTDGDLAEKFSVSRATIRLDRQALGIPQMRDRMEHLVAGSPEARGLQILDKDIGIKGVGLFQTSGKIIWRSRCIRRVAGRGAFRFDAGRKYQI